MTGEPPRQSRSEEEREAARLERERERAARAAKRSAKAKSPREAKPPRDAGPPRQATPGREATPERDAKPPRAGFAKPRLRRAPEPATPAAAEPDPPPRLPRDAAEPAPAARPREAAPAARPRDAAEAAPAARPRDAAARARSAAGRPAPDRASVRERADALLARRGPRGDAAPPGSPPGATPGRGRTGGSRRRRVVALVVLALLAGVALWLVLSLFQPGKGDGEGSVALTIPQGAGVGDIGDLLAERGVIDSGTFFELRATLSGSRGDLKPGTYELRRDMSYAAAIDALSAGPSPNLVNVTIPEGTARREVAGQIRKAGLKGNYVRASARSSGLNPRRYGAERARDLEGFLFPATYQLRRGSTVRSLVDKQLAAFKENWAKVDLRAARRANLTPYDVLIIASLVEREAQVDKERPLIASVVYNRLRDGTTLGIDATVRYAVNNWTEPLKRSELASPSPYNTRLRPGLPPGPIGNPGLESMRAAARPAKTGYRFYVVKPGACGEHLFAETDAEHQRNVARYEAARQAAGGRSPTDC